MEEKDPAGLACSTVLVRSILGQASSSCSAARIPLHFVSIPVRVDFAAAMPPKKAAPKQLPSKVAMYDRIQRLMSENSKLRAANRQRDQAMIAAATAFEHHAKKLRTKTTNGIQHSELLVDADDCRNKAERARFAGDLDTAVREDIMAQYWTKRANEHKAKADKGSPHQQTQPEQPTSAPKAKAKKVNKKTSSKALVLDYIPTWQRGQ